MAAALDVRELGRVAYADALALQHELAAARRRGAIPDTLLLLEHPPVITLGRRARGEHLLVSAEALAQRGIELHQVARGGDVTYHAPGQLVGYPIVDLAARGTRDVHRWLRVLEDLVGEALVELGLRWRRVPSWTGVFVDVPQGGRRMSADAQRAEGERRPGPEPERTARATAGRVVARARKIASIGVGVRGWVTLHGFALNVDVDLAGFDAIVPCGLQGVEMTSVARELGARAPADLPDRARAAVRDAFVARFG